jgi:predicted ATPase
MLKAIILNNFFSFKDTHTIKLNEGANLLLGINGSGKSSFINAIRLLSEGVAGDGLIKLIQEQWGGVAQIANSNGEKNTELFSLNFVFDYEKLNKLSPKNLFESDVIYRISISKLGETSYFLSERAENMSGHKYLEFYGGKGETLTRINISTHTRYSFQKYEGGDISSQELILRQINDFKYYPHLYVLRKAIESIAVYNSFNVEEGSKIRSLTEFSTDTRLRRNGANLTQMLNKLKLDNTFYFDRLEEEFKNINPNFKGIEIANLFGQSYLSLREKNMSRVIGAMHISDGTLRFLLLESIFYNPLRGGFVAIDEPERGLHPDMIHSIAEMIKYAAKDSQIIIATHSPLLLNQFELEDVLVFEKDENNSTIVKKVSENDFPDWEGDFLPGQMWLLGQIGGKRW